MKLLSVRNFINTAVFGIAAMQLVALFDVQHQLISYDGLAVYLPLVSAIGLIALWIGYRKFARSEKKIRAKSLQLSQESLALNTHGLVLVTDSNGIITHANENFLKTTGYDYDDIIQQHVDMLYYVQDIQQRMELKAKVDAGGCWQGETRIRKKDGSTLWTSLTILPGYDRFGKQCGAISVRTDITEIKNMRVTQEVFKTLNYLVDEVFIFELDTLRLKYANSAAEAAHGLEHTADPDASMRDVHPIYATECFEHALDTLRSAKNNVVNCEVEKNGRHYAARLQLLESESGSNDVLASFHDVSERVEAEKQRGEFISIVSHELRSPMTSVKGAMGLLLAGSAGPLDGKVRDILEIAHRNSDRLINIINDLLDIEKIAAGKMSFDCGAYEISALLDEAVLANENFSKRFDVSIERDENLKGMVFIDFDRSLQVMNNLLSNASKFSPPGGSVKVGGRETAQAFEITVADSGPGIPADMIGKIFDKFAQVERHKDGPVRSTGLGLAIVKAIAEEQGGTVSVTSELGQGSTFTVSFPKLQATEITPDYDELEQAS